MSIKNKLFYDGNTGYTLRFGYNGNIYARSIKTGRWTQAYDVGVWNPVLPALAPILEAAYQKWLKTASDDELKDAGL